MLADDVIARLRTNAPTLSARVFGAADLAVLMRRGELPQVTPAAHVVPGGISGGKITAAALGNFIQAIDRLVSVLVSFRGRDKSDMREFNTIGAVTDEVISALVGWTPDPASTGVFALRGMRLVSVAADALVYQIDFNLPDRLEAIS